MAVPESEDPSDPGNPSGAAAAQASETVGGAAGDATSTVSGLRAERDAALAKAAESHDQFLRARADAENARRRAQDELSKAHKFAIEGFAESLLPVMDSLEKALADGSAGPAALREGVQITMRQLRLAFERARLTEIDPAGEKFDPHRHQAISAVPGDGSIAPNHVASVLQKGWMISDRVLRPALVTVVQAGNPDS